MNQLFPHNTNLFPINLDKVTALPDRHISKEAASKYSVWVTESGQHVYPYFDKDGAHVANKLRGPNKTFMVQGQMAESGLFGQNAFPAGSAKRITLVEGECDAMAGFQIFGCKFPVVSVRNGASGARRDVLQNFDYLNSFDEIVICFDRDAPKVSGDKVRYPGQEAAQEVAALFKLGKVRILALQSEKDPNDYLKKGKSAEFTKEWWAAPNWTPAGIRMGKDLWEAVSSSLDKGVDYPWPSFNGMTYGIRKTEAVIIKADRGVGKTSVFKEIEHFLLQTTDEKVGILHLEETNRDSGLGLMSLLANKPLHLPDVRSRVTNEELKTYFEAELDNDRVVMWDHFGSNSIDNVLNTIRHMKNLGCGYVFLDHLSIIVSNQAADERKQLDELSTKLKTLCMEIKVAVIAAVHINRKGEIRGSAGVEQLANIIFSLDRDYKSADPFVRNVIRVTIEKNRFSGRTGPCCLLYYDPQTGRLSELEGESIKRYEEARATAAKEGGNDEFHNLDTEEW